MDMEKPDLKPFFNPKSIALVGVSRGEDRFGGNSYMIRLLESDFPGELYPINPKAEEILGLKAYPDLSSLPEVPDLAIVAVSASRCPAILDECARIGLKHVHVFSSGFKEIGTKEGKELDRQIADISEKNKLLVIGPNCMGPYCPSSGLTAWGAIPGMTGSLGIISQSGTLAQRLTEYTCSLGVGVEKAVSFGNAAVLDSCDFLEFMADDDRIKVIAMYLESVQDGRRFFNLVKTVNREKPIIFWKGGESEVGASTIASHTGNMAGERHIWEALFRQTGIAQVFSINEWVDAILAFYYLPLPTGKGIFLIGGGGGNSTVFSDTCIREGLDVPALSEGTMKKLRTIVPVAGSIAGNPLDFWQTFHDPECLAGILEMAWTEQDINMIIVDRLIPRKVFHTPPMPDNTPRTIDYLKRNPYNKPTVFTVDSDGGDPDLAMKGLDQRVQFCEAGIPAYPSLQRAARALAHLHQYSLWVDAEKMPKMH
jgi:acyl-CoA synthetase (NDP forming)